MSVAQSDWVLEKPCIGYMHTDQYTYLIRNTLRINYIPVAYILHLGQEYDSLLDQALILVQ